MSADPPPGAPRYVPVHPLGQGRFGDVWLARHRGPAGFERQVALKRLRHTDDERDRRALEAEARVLALLHHPSIVAVTDLVQLDGAPALVMEYVPGESLADLFARGMPASVVAEVVLRIALALDAAHNATDPHTGAALTLVHRDIKPANVRITPRGGVKVLDFGLAGLPGAGRSGGTRAYAAPERFDGAVGPASDVFSLGVLFAEGLTSARPVIDPRSRAATLAACVDVVDRCPAAARPVLQAMLAFDAAGRPTAAAVARDAGRLARVLAGPTLAEWASTHLVAPAPIPAERVTLRPPPPPPPLPERPWPLLAPCTHPVGFAGRAADVAGALALLSAGPPVVALHAPAGAGKSSFVLAGLLPALRRRGVPCAVDRQPWVTGLAARLADALVADPGDPVARLRAAARAGHPPVLVVDQAEALLATDAAEVRALIEETVAGPTPCRWLLVHRRDAHGGLQAWLGPLAAHTRAWALPPAGRGPDDGRAAFRDAVAAPLALRQDGRPRYGLVADDAAIDRVADGFAALRRASPHAPLLPELQVVLERLVREAEPDGEGLRRLDVPPAEVLAGWLRDALSDHVLQVLARVAGARPADRTLALLVLRLLVAPTGDRRVWRPADALGGELGPVGRRVLHELQAEGVWLVVRESLAGVDHVSLPHDTVAAAVRQLLDRPDALRGAGLEPDVVHAWALVDRRVQAWRSGDRGGVELDAPTWRSIRRAAPHLPWTDGTRAWWGAVREARAARRRQLGWVAVGVLVVAAVLAVVAGRWVDARRLEAQVAGGSAEQAATALYTLHTRYGYDGGALLDAADHREPDARDRLFAFGWRALPDGAAEALARGTAGHGLERPRAASLLGARLLMVDDARLGPDVREALLAPWRAHRPPPPLDGEAWVRVPGGSFRMGCDLSGTVDACRSNDVPFTAVIAPVRMLRHEVTLDEYRRFDPDPGVESGSFDNNPGVRPVSEVNWYEAHAYASWLGARLPTEAEFEHAARAGSSAQWWWGDSRAALPEHAWFQENSAGPEAVEGRAPNPLGLYDLAGNVSEWCADWSDDYPTGEAVDPRGPALGWLKSHRGGGYYSSWVETRAGARIDSEPEARAYSIGFRIVAPGVRTLPVTPSAPPGPT